MTRESCVSGIIEGPQQFSPFMCLSHYRDTLSFPRIGTTYTRKNPCHLPYVFGEKSDTFEIKIYYFSIPPFLFQTPKPGFLKDVTLQLLSGPECMYTLTSTHSIVLANGHLTFQGAGVCCLIESQARATQSLFSRAQGYKLACSFYTPTGRR